MDRKGTKMFLSLAKNGGSLKMPGDEHKIMNRAENRARSAIISSTKCIKTTVSHELRRGKR